MQTIFQMNADEIDESFIGNLKVLSKHKEIEIVVYERDETAYLLRSEKNWERLLQTVSDIKENKNLVVPEQEQFK